MILINHLPPGRLKRCTNRAIAGFSLVEVLIAIAIASIGLASIVELQRVSLKLSSKSTARSAAMTLIQQTTEQAQSTPYALLSDGHDAVTLKHTTYQRQWRVTQRYFINNKWQQSASVPPSVELLPTAKLVTVTVKWKDSDSQSQQLTHQRHIVPQTAEFYTPNNQWVGQQLIVPSYSNNIANLSFWTIPLLDTTTQNQKQLRKLTTQPIERTNGAITFDSTIIDKLSNKQSLRRFTTINCQCRFAPKGVGITPLTLKLSIDGLTVDPHSAKSLVKDSATTLSSNPLCSRCCKNHHDTNQSIARYQPHGQDNHPHYDALRNILRTSGDYQEGCRFMRVDGYNKLVPDWLLIKLTIVPHSLQSNSVNGISNKVRYGHHIKALVKAHLLGQPLNQIGTLFPQLTAIKGSTQVSVRGLYVDLASLDDSDRQALVKAVNKRSPNWLLFTPFYDIDLTNFVSWQSNAPNIVEVTNWPNNNNNAGTLLLKQQGQAQLRAIAAINNDGIARPKLLPSSPSFPVQYLQSTLQVTVLNK